eukprot:4027949-Alexandrium_andersonii.AAC.1
MTLRECGGQEECSGGPDVVHRVGHLLQVSQDVVRRSRVQQVDVHAPRHQADHVLVLRVGVPSEVSGLAASTRRGTPMLWPTKGKGIRALRHTHACRWEACATDAADAPGLQEQTHHARIQLTRTHSHGHMQ